MNEPFKFDSSEFDVVYARLSLHYFTNEVTIKILNETSVTSYTRDFFSGKKSVESYSRVPNPYGLLTPYGTIKQSFTEVRSYPSSVFFPSTKSR